MVYKATDNVEEYIKIIEKLLEDGYDRVDDEKFSKYLKVVTKQDSSKNVRDAFDLKVKIK